MASFHDKIASKAPSFTSSDRAYRRNPRGEKTEKALKLKFDKRLRLEFQGKRRTIPALGPTIVRMTAGIKNDN